MDRRIEECSKAYGNAKEVGAKKDHIGKGSQALKGKGEKD